MASVIIQHQVVLFPALPAVEQITQLELGALLSLRNSERTLMGHTPAKEKAILKALNLTAEEEKEFLKTAEEAGVSLDQLIRSLLRGYAEGKQIRQ